MKEIKAGDRVAFTADFVRYAGGYCFGGDWRGTVLGLDGNGRTAYVRWDGDGDGPMRVAVGNLCHPSHKDRRFARL